jgi:hypothetical protein
MQNTLEDFLIEHGVIFADMELLGSGENGTAWRCNDFVVKQTRSRWEYDFAVRQTVGEWPHFAKVYGTFRNDRLFFYVADYLDKDEDIQYGWNAVEYALNGQGVEMIDVNDFDYAKFKAKYPKGFSASAKRFFQEIKPIALDMKRIGGTDMHPGNLGYDGFGNLRAYDIDINAGDKDSLTGNNSFRGTSPENQAAQRAYWKKMDREQQFA